MYKNHIKELTRFLNRQLQIRKLPDVVAEYSAVSGVPLLDVYKLAAQITGRIDECERETKRLKEQLG